MLRTILRSAQDDGASRPHDTGHPTLATFPEGTYGQPHHPASAPDGTVHRELYQLPPDLPGDGSPSFPRRERPTPRRGPGPAAARLRRDLPHQRRFHDPGLRPVRAHLPGVCRHLHPLRGRVRPTRRRSLPVGLRGDLPPLRGIVPRDVGRYAVADAARASRRSHPSAVSRIRPGVVRAHPAAVQPATMSGGSRSSANPSLVRSPRYTSSSSTASAASSSLPPTTLRPSALARS